MKNLLVDVEEDGQIVHTVTIEVTDQDSADTIAQKISETLKMDLEEIIDSSAGELEAAAANQSDKEQRIRIRRVCIELHFESHSARHNFSSKSKWARVHRWGCRKFSIAQDACANLELHEGTATGAVLNESKQIGTFTGCKTVWLVKPGPEPNGQ